MPDAEKIIAEALVADAHADDGWLSDAQTAQLNVNSDGSVSFCGEGSIDVAHVASIAVAALREAGMLTETEWEYQCRLADNPWTEVADRTHGVNCSGTMRRRRKAGPWEPVEGDPR